MPKRNPTNGYYALRWQILKRDNFTCQYCGQYAPNVKLEVDHIVPIEDDGTDEPSNLKTSCYACNRGKSGLRIIQQRRAKPFQPTTRAVSPRILRLDKIRLLLDAHPEGLTATQVAKEQDITIQNAFIALGRAVKANAIRKVVKVYFPFEAT